MADAAALFLALPASTYTAKAKGTSHHTLYQNTCLEEGRAFTSRVVALVRRLVMMLVGSLQ